MTAKPVIQKRSKSPRPVSPLASVDTLHVDGSERFETINVEVLNADANNNNDDENTNDNKHNNTNNHVNIDIITVTNANSSTNTNTNTNNNDTVINMNTNKKKPRISVLKSFCPRIKALQTQGGFFSKHLEFKLYLPQKQIEIFRRYDDFSWLYKKLIQRYGHSSYIPALPKKIKISKLDKQMISGHCKEMQEFIIELFKYQNLFDDGSTVFFFDPKNKQNFTKVRKSFIANKPPLSKEEIEAYNQKSTMRYQQKSIDMEAVAAAVAGTGTGTGAEAEAEVNAADNSTDNDDEFIDD